MGSCERVRTPAPAETTEAERRQVEKAVLKRQREFLTGRVAARRALERLGIPTSEIPVLPNRAPQWPEGIVGSIAHSKDFCMVAVAHAHSIAGIGLDVEPDSPLEAELWPRICRPEELAWLLEYPAAERGGWARRFFCAKEAVYKAQHPSSGVFLGFQDLKIIFSPTAHSFDARVVTESETMQELSALTRDLLAERLAAGSGYWVEESDSLFFRFQLFLIR